MGTTASIVHHEPWNKGNIVGQKAPFKIRDIWALRVRLQMENRVRELALFNLGIDSKLRGAILSRSASATFAMATKSRHGPWCCSTRLKGPFSSKSR